MNMAFLDLDAPRAIWSNSTKQPCNEFCLRVANLIHNNVPERWEKWENKQLKEMKAICAINGVFLKRGGGLNSVAPGFFQKMLINFIKQGMISCETWFIYTD